MLLNIKIMVIPHKNKKRKGTEVPFLNYSY